VDVCGNQVRDEKERVSVDRKHHSSFASEQTSIKSSFIHSSLHSKRKRKKEKKELGITADQCQCQHSPSTVP
jgi:hypothetical protein